MSYSMSYGMEECESLLRVGEKIKWIGGMVGGKVGEGLIGWGEEDLKDDRGEGVVVEVCCDDMDVGDGFGVR
ncbi:hypothetical protein [Bacillus thuringiensis]|uniref:hypothetical protein n=1 Tax=Bacillus thuringiensis TaxID=1428 RepID=UPI00119D0A99|nr:hypothetical protein [Bacillus thuringiensis]